MEKFFNIAGPCNPADHYMLSATERLPEVVSLICKKQYFVIHAQRQCGKTTALLALRNEINSGSERVAMYCSLEAAEGVADPEKGIPMICERIRSASKGLIDLKAGVMEVEYQNDSTLRSIVSGGVSNLLSALAVAAGKPLVVLFDEVDCLCDATLVAFLRQLRDGAISKTKGVDFPSSIALVGMRNIRDYKAKVRPDHESLGSASPFNVLTEAMTLRTFTDAEVAALYAQHTAATGQVFEPDAVRLACEYTCGQPYLVNALARWCVEKIHRDDYSKPVTAADMHEAKEKIIRERGTHLDSLMERMKEPRVRRIVEPVMLGDDRPVSRNSDDYQYALDLGLVKEDSRRRLVPANPMYAETIARYLTRDDQDDMLSTVPDAPWATDDGLDMQGLLLAFQDFWRENAQMNRAPFEYNEAYPHIVLQAFLQRVLNGGGEIIREMALGKGALDLGVLFRGRKYAVEVKLRYLWDKNPEKALLQVRGYVDRLGVDEGWLVVFDPDMAKPWDEKISHEDRTVDGKPIHVFYC